MSRMSLRSAYRRSTSSWRRDRLGTHRQAGTRNILLTLIFAFNQIFSKIDLRITVKDFKNLNCI